MQNTQPNPPDSPPLKLGTPESPPLKPPLPLPFNVPALKAPPPVPPKTYAKPEKKPREEPVEVIVQIEPKQSNIERARAVRFHPDAKIPIEDDPPPIPVRGVGPTAKRFPTVAIEMGTVAMESDTTSSDGSTNDTESEAMSDVVAIVDASGALVGELVPSPVEKTPPSVRLSVPTSP